MERNILEFPCLDLVKKLLGDLKSLSAHNHSCWQEMWWKMKLFTLINYIRTWVSFSTSHTYMKAPQHKGVRIPSETKTAAKALYSYLTMDRARNTSITRMVEVGGRAVI